jgi:hypothetical protein
MKQRRNSDVYEFNDAEAVVGFSDESMRDRMPADVERRGDLALSRSKQQKSRKVGKTVRRNNFDERQ